MRGSGCLLHGNPTSSFIWRNIIPHIQGQARVIAPDLIMGDSDKLEDSGPGYRFVEHRHYLDLLLERLQPEDVVMVGSTGVRPWRWTGPS